MPWTLGTEVHVGNLHAREGVHVDGDFVAGALTGKQDTLTGTSDVPGLDAALAAKQPSLTFVTSSAPSTSAARSLSVEMAVLRAQPRAAATSDAVTRKHRSTSLNTPCSSMAARTRAFSASNSRR